MIAARELKAPTSIDGSDEPEARGKSRREILEGRRMPYGSCLLFRVETTLVLIVVFARAFLQG
jgi:hypothetical protein